jgi:hypothetical protein
MSWRRLLPLVLLGLLGAAIAGAAALGAVQSPAALSPEAPSKLFHTDVAHTLQSKSFTIHFAGQLVAYQAPNRTEVVGPNDTPFDLAMSVVTIGSSSYIHFGDQWSKMPFAPLGLGGSSAVLGYLRALAVFKTANLNGDSFVVHGMESELPQALVTLIFTTVTHGPNHQFGASFTEPRLNKHTKVIGVVTVKNGRVTSESFTALGAHGRASRTGTITYTQFDSSPAIAAPTKADLASPTSPCGSNAKGSCQVTTKGDAPNSPMCKDIRDHAGGRRSQSDFAQVQAAASSGQWNAIRRTQLTFLAVEGSLVRAVGPSLQNAPSAVRLADHTEVRYLHVAKSDLSRSKSFSQYKAFTTPILAKMIGAFELLAQYEGKQCGTTTTYFGSSEGTLSQSSTGTP